MCNVLKYRKILYNVAVAVAVRLRLFFQFTLNHYCKQPSDFKLNVIILIVTRFTVLYSGKVR